MSERWFRLLLRLYPADFRDDMGDSVVEGYVPARRVLGLEPAESLRQA
jgi:hypothetical protein